MQYRDMNSHYLNWHMTLFSGIYMKTGILPWWQGYKAHIDFLNGGSLYINQNTRKVGANEQRPHFFIILGCYFFFKQISRERGIFGVNFFGYLFGYTEDVHVIKFVCFPVKKRERKIFNIIFLVLIKLTFFRLLRSFMCQTPPTLFF